MPFEFTQLRRALLRVGICFFLVTLLAASLSVRWIPVGFIALPVPSGIGGSISSAFIDAIRTDFLPQGANLAVRNPLEAFTVSITISAVLGLLCAILLALYELWRFARPGLYKTERRGLAFVLFSALPLMAAGAAFAYRVLIPAIYFGLYGFLPHGVLPLFGLQEVVDQVLGIMLTTALAFLLPVAMFLLTMSGVVGLRFWRAYSRHVFVIFLVSAAIITPDGSGISMVLFTVPLFLLYCLGYIASAYALHRRSKRRV